MILIDKNNQLSSSLELIIQGLNIVRVDAVAIEFMQMPRDEIYLVNQEAIGDIPEQCLNNLSHCLGIVVFYKDNFVEEWLQKLKVIDAIHFGDIKSLLIRKKIIFWSNIELQTLKIKSQFLSLNQDLNSIIANLDEELQKSKQYYAENIPKRIEKLPMLNIFSKYLIGNKAGSDFYDLIRTKDADYVFMSSTNSYLASSSILANFINFKQKKKIAQSDIYQFFKDLAEVRDLLADQKQAQIALSLMIVKLPHNDLEMEFYIKGQFLLMNKQGRLVFNESTLTDGVVHAKYLPERDEKLLLGGPGLDQAVISLNLDRYAGALLAKQDLSLAGLDDLFIETTHKMQQSVAKSDFSAVILEVRNNAIYKV